MKKEIILVGTFHFEQLEELLKDKEKEVEELVDYLCDFKPTKVALEWEKTKNKELNEEYKNSNGNYTMDEIQQVGFRLVKKLQHDKVYAVNWTGKITQDDMINLNNAIKSSYPELINMMGTLSENAAEISPNTKLIHSYQKLNGRESIEELEKLYLSFVVVDDGNGEGVGVNFLNKWVERELMIFKNIIEVSSIDSDDRILLVIGSDHLWMLRKLFEGMGWDVINPFSI